MKSNKQLIHTFLDHIYSFKNYSDHTVNNYERDLMLLFQYSQKKILDFTAFTKLHCREFMSSINQEKNPRTLSRYISTYRSFWKFLTHQNYCKYNPWANIRLPKISETLPHVLSTQDVLNFLSQIPTTTSISLRNRTICECLYGMGLRVSELCSLELKHCNIKKGECLILGKGKKDRMVYIGNVTAKILIQYLHYARPVWASKHSSTLILNPQGNAITPRTIQRIVQSCSEKQGFGKKITPHTLRHCFATDLYKGGADLSVIKDLLGHSNLSTTEIYTHVANEDLSQTIRESHPHGHD